MPDGGAVVKENGQGWEGFWGERGPRQAARASFFIVHSQNYTTNLAKCSILSKGYLLQTTYKQVDSSILLVADSVLLRLDM